VLTVAKVIGRQAAGYAEYLEGKTQATDLGDYYLKDGERVEAPGRWVRGAATVGCEPVAPVTGDALRALMQVRRPDTGKPLRRAGASGEAVAALDATFSAPKTVSAVWAIASAGLRAEIEAAHERAVDRALGYAIERVAMIRERVGREQVIHQTAADVVATSWRHTTARAVGDRPPDPQLHSHVLVHAAARRDGRLVAIDSRSWLVHRRELGAAYRTELARGLTQLGFSIERGTGRGGRYFEIAGVPQALVDRWSSRHHQVQEAIDRRRVDKEQELAQMVDAGGPDAHRARQQLQALRASGQLAAGEDRYMAYTTRNDKQLRTRTDLDQDWRATGQRHHFHQRQLTRIRSTEPRVAAPVDPRVLVDGLTEFDATFTDRDARAVALEAGCGLPIPAAIAQLSDLHDAGELLDLADGRLTTRVHRARERQTVAAADRLTGHAITPIPRHIVDRQARRLDAALHTTGGRLTAEQRTAIELACSDRPLVVIEGQAGTGKSTVLTAIARAHQAAGQQLIVTSTAALAARRLATELDHAEVPTSTFSTVALRHAITTRRLTLTPFTTLIHDEAALASTSELQPLLDAVDQAGARLILIGDPRQSHAVGAGGLWPHLEHATKGHDAHVELTRNVRAHDPADRRDQRHFRQCRHEDAIRSYATRGRVTITREQRHAEDIALDAAHADRTAGKVTLVVAQTSNDRLDELNARAQAIHHQAGILGHTGLDLPGRPYRLHAGDHVQIRHTIPHPDLGQIRNGQTGRVTTIDTATDALTLDLGPGQHARLHRGQIDRADLRLAYVQHPFPAQGHTTDTTHLIVSDHATQEGTYVALTRARQTTHMYTSHQQLDYPDEPLPALAQHTGRTEPDVPSIHTPLAHETEVTTDPAYELTADRSLTPGLDPATQSPIPIHNAAVELPTDQRRDAARLVEVLGGQPDPRDPAHTAWQRAATAIQRYRHDYAIADDDTPPLGPEPSPGAFQQRLDRRDTAQLVSDARDQLGLPGLEPSGDERPPATLAPRADRDLADRSDSWEL
jgi:conjugative relaxase-like TrwC/TraI family protein